MSATAPVDPTIEQAKELLAPIEHIVVVMLENRSFDHTLGYLAQPPNQLDKHQELPTQINSFPATFANEFEGRQYLPQPLDEDTFLCHKIDPPHDFEHVATQISNGTMGGFVKALSDSLEQHRRTDDAHNPDVLQSAMSYLTREHVPVYDHLAHNFCVCDSWFCSVPGPTLPNRFFSVAATTDGGKSDNDMVLHHFGKFTSLFQYLEPTAWRWYSSDPGLLRAIDKNYTFDIGHEHFAYFDQLTEEQPRSFLRDVLGDSQNDPDLPAVAWIDPNFNIKDEINIPGIAALASIGPRTPGSNDDHPPMPVILGQKLVNKIYTALGNSQYWDKCLLVVTYDEHGGFFDHQPPPPGHGPRVPILLVSPHVQRGVCSEPLDHASLIKTILLRFGHPNSIDDMPEPVTASTDLSVALRKDGQTIPYTPVSNAGAAAIKTRDLMPTFLPHGGSTLNRATSFLDDTLTDLQRTIIYGIAIPLRTGYLSLRRAQHRRWLRRLAPILRFPLLRKPRHLKRRRP
jgi:phospholipase C